jgi:hypothetical protein
MITCEVTITSTTKINRYGKYDGHAERKNIRYNIRSDHATAGTTTALATIWEIRCDLKAANNEINPAQMAITVGNKPNKSASLLIRSSLALMTRDYFSRV